MRTKFTLLLVFLNVALFFFIFHFQRQWDTERKYVESRKRVLGPEVATIQSLEISSRTGRFAEPVKLEKQNNNWWITRPTQWPANPNAVARITNELQMLEHETSFLVKDLAKNNQTLADYGLEKPQITLTFTSALEASSGTSTASKTSAPVTIGIGDTTKIGNRLYVLSADGQRIHVVGRSLIESLDLSLDQLRNDAVFSIPVFEARALNLQTIAPANLKVRLRRDGSRWIFEAPITTRANKNEVELVISGLDALHASSFPDAKSFDDARTGLVNPVLRLTLEGNNRSEVMLLGSAVQTTPAPADAANNKATDEKGTAYYARMEDKPTLFTVVIRGELYDKLRNAQEVLRETRFLDFVEPHSVTAVNISAPNAPELTLQRLETGKPAVDSDPWQVVTRTTAQAPQPQPADLGAVQRLLEKLNRLQAMVFVSDAPAAADLENWGFNRPEREVTLTLVPTQNGLTPGSPTTVTLQLGAANEKSHQIYAKLSNSPSVYLVDTEIVKEIQPSALYFRDRLVRELPTGAQVTHLKLTDLSDNKVLLDRPLAEQSGGDAAAKAQNNKVSALASELRTLRTKRYVSDRFSPTVEIGGENRPWKYALDVEISLGSGNGSQTEVSTLNLSDRFGGDVQLVGSQKLNVIFEADQKLIDALFAITYGPLDPGPASPEKPKSTP